MRKGILGVALIGAGATVVLSLMATHYLGSSPRIAELMELRRGLDSDGRLHRLYYAPKPAPPAGSEGHGLRVIYKFEHGPSHGTPLQQANRLGDTIFKRWAGTPALAFVEIRDVTHPAGDPGGWIRVEPLANPWEIPPATTVTPRKTAGPPGSQRGGSRD